MATTINADTVSGGAIVSGDATGILGLQAAGNTLVTLNGNVVSITAGLLTDDSATIGGTLSVGGTLTAPAATVTNTLIAGALTLGGTAVTSSAVELNILDGVTATAAELNILDSAAVTTAELNILSGATVNTAELNYNDINTLGTSQASKVVTADANGDVTLSEELKAKSYNETYVALSGTTPTVDCEAGNVFALTTSGNTTFTFSNPPASGTGFGFSLKVTAGGTHTLTWPSSVDWAGGSAPDAPASGETDMFVFVTHDGGTTWYGFLAGDALA